MIRDATPHDAQAIVDIYNYYIAHTTVTFEEEPLTAEMMAQRMATVAAKFFWLVYESNGEILGYAYATAWRERSAYRYSVEGTIYLKNTATGQGIGYELYSNLIKRLENRAIHAVIGGVTLPNAASVRLHEKLGFTKVAQFKEVGYKFNQWLDVGYWELMIDKK